jgi:damage-control phosphatase, subfamily III
VLRWSFSYETVTNRWPIILTKLVDQVHQINHALTMKKDSEGDLDWEKRVEEGKRIIEKVSKLKYEMARDHTLKSVLFELTLGTI